MDVTREDGGERNFLHGMFPKDLPVATLEEALRLQEQAAAIGKEFGHVRLEVAGLSDAARVLVAMGENEQALSKAQAAANLGAGLEPEGAARAVVAQCMKAVGDVENAIKEAELARQLLIDEELKTEQYIQLMVVYAELLAESGAMDGADSLFAEAWQRLNDRADVLTAKLRL